MSKTKGFLLVAAAAAMTFTLSCSSDENKDGNSNISTCGDKEYNITVYSCERGELVGSCRGKPYYPEYEYCENGEIKDGTEISSGSISSSSSSIEPSSSSYAPPSSSSVVPSSSSYGGLCAGFVEGTEREHYGKMKKQFCDERDGNKYVYVEIGDQTWMAENLNYTPSSGTFISCDTHNCAYYGRLYDWSTAMGFASSCNSNTCYILIQSPHRGICPSGWHIPSNADWEKLFRYADGTSDTSSPYNSPTAGKHLKSRNGWNTCSGRENLDTYGFSALSGGYGISDGSVRDIGTDGNWWSTSESGSSYAYSQRMSCSSDGTNWNYYGIKNDLFSVRCLQDNSTISSSSLAVALSSSSISGSSSSSQSNSVFCDFGDGDCREFNKDACLVFGQVVESCPGTAVSSSSSAPPSSSSEVESSSSVEPSSSSETPPSVASGTFEDSRDGQTYKWVKIGTQTWMAQNLNHAPNSGTFISCDIYTCTHYGRLYDWSTAMGFASSCNSNTCSSLIQSPHSGICPSGWHIPSQAEWNTLSSYVQSNSGCSNCGARLLKTTSGWSNRGNGTDQYGFSALPGGYSSSDGKFSFVGSVGYWWTTSEYNSDLAYGRYMGYNGDYVGGGGENKDFLFSVRCLQD